MIKLDIIKDVILQLITISPKLILAFKPRPKLYVFLFFNGKLLSKVQISVLYIAFRRGTKVRSQFRSAFIPSDVMNSLKVLRLKRAQPDWVIFHSKSSS